MSRHDRWRQRLAHIQAAGRTRRLRSFTPTGPVTGTLEGQDVVVFCANDYLGLAQDPRVREAARGPGVGASRLISGDRPLHHALEAAVEAWLGREVVLFNSGFAANTGTLPALFGRGDRVASDANNHASLIDGLRLSRAEVTILAHNDLGSAAPDAAGVVLESLYSMDGDFAPLHLLPPGPLWIVDEAHAVGCVGPAGRGWCAARGVDTDVLIGTFGKAFGAAGAFVAGPPPLRDLLVNTARTLIFSTGLPESVVAAALAGFTLAGQEPERRESLAHNAARLRQGLRQLGWRPLGEAHIVPVVVGPHAMSLADHLLDQGFFAAGIRPPTVPAGTERIRLTVSASHTPAHIDTLLDALGPARHPEEPWTPR